VLARAAGFDALAAIVFSATTFAGSAQFATVSVLGDGGTTAAAIGAAVLLNARYLAIGFTAAGALAGGWRRRLLEAQLVWTRPGRSPTAVRAPGGADHRGCRRLPRGDARRTAGVSEAWIAVVVVGVVTIAMKAVGPLAAHGRELPAPLARVVDLLAPAVLAALVAIPRRSAIASWCWTSVRRGSRPQPWRSRSGCRSSWRWRWPRPWPRCCAW
jgi:AzlC protein